jgi:hypothetical protein
MTVTKRLLVALALVLAPALMSAADVKAPDKKKKAPPKKDKKPPKKDAKKKPPKKVAPPAGKVYLLRPDAPGWATCDLDVRDPSDDLWPNFFYGRPGVVGAFTYDPKKPKATFVLNCDQRAQRNGDQSRRVLGDLLKGNAALGARFTVLSLGGPRSEEEETTDAKGRTSRRPVEYTPFRGTLELGDRQVNVNGKATYRFSKAGSDGTPESVYLELRFSVKGRDLGLARIKGDLDCRAGATGYLKPPGR